MNGICKSSCIGVPLPGTEAKICDIESHKDLAQGEEGELVLSWAADNAGYYNNQSENERAITTVGCLLVTSLTWMNKVTSILLVAVKI